MVAATGGRGSAASIPIAAQAGAIPTPPPATHGDDDGGALDRLIAAHAGLDQTAPRDLAARVAAATQRLDALYPAQAPGAAAPFGIPAWQSLGPTRVIHLRVDGYTGPTNIGASENGRVRKILVDPRDSNVVYVLLAAGGLWKTTNFLQQHPVWTPLTDRLDTVSSGSIAFGSSPDTLYLGLGDPFSSFPAFTGIGGLMLKSTNGGATWSSPIALPGATSVEDIAVDTSGPQATVLVGTDGGLFRSTNGGTTYVAVQDAPVQDPSTPIDDQLFFGATTWSIVRTSMGWLASVENGGTFDGGVGYLACSTDHGATWTECETEPFAYGGRATLAVGAPGDNVVYAFQGWYAPYQAYQRDVFRSNDGGLTWHALHTTTTSPVNPTPETGPGTWVALYQAWYDQMIWVDPTDPTRNTVFIGGDLYTAKTTDGGQNWRLMTQWLGAYGLPYLHADNHAAAFVPGKKPLLVVGNDGGLAVSDDGGVTWSFDKNDGIAGAAIYGFASTPADPKEILIGTQDTGTLARQGNTSTFNQVLGGDGFDPAIGQADNKVSLATIEGGVVARSTSTPQNQVGKWSVSLPGSDDAYFETPLVAPTAAADPTGLVFYTYTQHDVLRTNDGGLTWYPILAADPAGPAVVRESLRNLAVDPASPDGVVVGGYGGVVYVTRDGGASWHPHSLLGLDGFGGFISAVAWAPGATLYVGSENLAPGAVRLMRSTDDGQTWSAAAAVGLPDLPIVALTPDPSDPTGRTVYAGTWIGVFRTTDGGQSWSLFGAGLPHDYVSQIYVAPDGSFVRVSTYGRGIWEAARH